MDYGEGRPAKRVKPDYDFPSKSEKKLKTTADGDAFSEPSKPKLNQKSKFKSKASSTSSIINTIDLTDNNKIKKAISKSELDILKENSKKAGNVQKLTSIIDIKDGSDISMNSGSSPFKIIRSSQDFNLESPIGRMVTKQENDNVTPTMSKAQPGSDDGIFWITTPQQGTEQNDVLKLSNKDIIEKLPSSPLKNVKDSQIKDLPDTLLDPELKKLLEKFDAHDKSDIVKLDKKPLFNRASSDSRALKASNKSPKKLIYKNARQLVATKSSLNESAVDQVRKLFVKENQVDVSDMLLQIGSKLQTSVPDLSVNNGDLVEHNKKDIIENKKDDIITDNTPEVVSKKTGKDSANPPTQYDADSSDAFSDEIDVSEIVANATQFRTTQLPIKQQTSDIELNSDISWRNDDDDDIMDKITDKQVRQSRPNTDQTDMGDIIEEETKEVTKEIKMIDLNRRSKTPDGSTVKYKGLIRNESYNDNIESIRGEILNKPFKLFNDDQNLAKSALTYKLLKRLQIKSIRKGVFKRASRTLDQYILNCLTPNDTLINIIVRDHWVSLNFKINDIIHIIVSKEGDNFQLVDKDHNLLIWNPDILLSATKISDAIDCKRKTIITQKFTGPGAASVPLIIGNVTHSIFQKCLLNRRIDDEFMDDAIEDELDAYALEIYSVNKSKEDFKSTILEHTSYIKEWIETYVPLKNNNFKLKQKTEYKATNILDIEENIMSPVFGIRGLIDVVIEAQLSTGGKHVIPLEIKTGRQYISNSAQVSLYTLLIKQRYEVESFYTSLVYTKLKECYLNSVNNKDFRMLVNIRNELSQFLMYAITNLPPLLNRSSCERCFNLEPCMVLNKLTEDGTADESGIDIDMYNDLTIHLNKPEYKEFYEHWDTLITKEEGLVNFTKSELWKNSADYRESNGGYCVGNLKVVGCDFSPSNNKFVYMFERDSSVFPPLTSSQLAKNDRILLSDESMFGLTVGHIKLIRPDIIIILTDNNWSNSAVKLPDFRIENNQVFKSVLRSNDSKNGLIEIDESVKSKSFRIDKDQISVSMAMARFNLLNLFLPDGDSKSRELIVELKAPRFSEEPQFKYNINDLVLNDGQLKAVDTVSKIEDYCLILGMPGTGKTTVISSLIDCIVKSGKTALISSYTHSAVDNICEKLIKNAKKRQEKLSLLRVGTMSRINPNIYPYCLYSDQYCEEINNKNDFQSIIDETQIVASTCLGMTDIIFGMGKRFDYCIVDEASQVPLPVVLGPISFSDKFILVGDHYQLPPLVLHPEAKRDGLDQSLFQILSDKHPSSVVELTHQYRMCSDIMSLSNELIYDGRLKCGSEVIANQTLMMPSFNSLPISSTFIQDILRPERKVVFVNEDNISNISEVSIGDKIENPGEAKMITILIKILLLSGVQEKEIGVMSFYKAQLRHFFVSLMKYKDIEILTADRFQGRDKDVIIISLVRTEVLGDLLKEWRRVNVAITRARCKLIIFGSKKLLESNDQFEGFIDMIKSNGWYYDLREGDEKIAQELNFLDHNEQSQHQMGNADCQFDSQKYIAKLDGKSKAIRKTKILKYVMDDLSK